MRELRAIGIQPDILLCHSDRPIPESERRKLALFCNVRESAVIEALDVGQRLRCAGGEKPSENALSICRRYYTFRAPIAKT